MPEVSLNAKDYKRLISLLSLHYKKNHPNREDKKLLAKIEVLHDAEVEEDQEGEEFKNALKS